MERQIRTTGFSRRHLAKALGATLCVPRFLRSALAAPATPEPRLVLLMQSNGVPKAPGLFWPDTALSSPILDPITSDPALRAKTTVIKGLQNKSGGAGVEHDRGFAGFFSGYRTVDNGIGGGPSLDQVLKQALRPKLLFPTLNVAVAASYILPKNPYRGSFVYTGARQVVPPLTDPGELYATLFAGGAGSDPARAMQLLRQQKSVLDFGAGDLEVLKGRLGPEERARLDLHAQAVRELEARLTAAAAPVERPPGCKPPAGDVNLLDLHDEANVPTLMKLMTDLLVAAIGCNLTRFVTFQWGYGGNQWRFRWLGIDKNTHLDVAHADTGKNPAVTEMLRKMNVWYAQHVLALVKALDAIPEGGGSALDNSVVVWGNELADGPHGLVGIPAVLFGSAGGRLKKTGLLVDQGAQDYHRLGATLATLMGMPSEGFGEAKACGLLQGVSV